MKAPDFALPRLNGTPPAPPVEPAKGRLRVIVVLVSIVVLGVAGWIAVRAFTAPRVGYITARIVRKTLVQSVTATGTVNPQDTILIGTQVSGTITEQDADYNTIVKRGQILTRLDPTSFQAQLDAAESSENQASSASNASEASAVSAQANTVVAHQNVATARAALASAASQVGKAKAALYLATVTAHRDQELLAQGYIAQQQFDTDTANVAAAESAEDAAVMAVRQAQAQVDGDIAAEQASIAQAQSAAASAVASRQAVGIQRAAVAQARYDFNNAVIRSQVNGTVIARNITIGQTVAASFTTPTLFTIGRDLTKMEVDVAVGEPDIGGVRAGDAVAFTVLAYPNRTFHGAVYQVRRNPTTINNVVTYDTVVYVENKDGALYPGMTASASIQIAAAKSALVVPVSALQWAPATSGTRSASSGGPSSPWGTTEASETRTVVAGRNGRIFELREGNLVRVPVRVVLVSGTEAAIALAGSTLNVGDTVVTTDTLSQMSVQQAPQSSALTQQSSFNRPGGGGGR